MVNKPQIISSLEAGLRAAQAQQSAIANNIANLDTPGYRRFEVEFDKKLAEMIKAGRGNEFAPEPTQPRNTPVDERGNDVSLDVEVGELIKNSGRYKTYLRVLNKMYRQMEQAIGDMP